MSTGRPLEAWLLALLVAALVFVVVVRRLENPPADPAEVSTEPSLDGPHPSQTRSAERRRAATPAPPAAGDDGPEERPPVRIGVVLGTWRSTQGQSGSLRGFDPSGFWPTRAEAPFPASVLTDAVIASVHGEGDTAAEAEDRIVDLFRGGEELGEGPWADVVALEVLRVTAGHEWRQARAEFLERHGIGDPREIGWAAYNEALDAVEEPAPVVEFGPLVATAQATVEQYPGHPAADYAWLYLMDGLGSRGGDQYAPEALGDAAMEVLSTAADPLVLDAAVTALSNSGPEAGLLPEDLDALLEVFDDPEAGVPRRQLAELAVQTALAAEDMARSAQWSPRLVTATAETCAEFAAAGRPHHTEWCSGATEQAVNVSSWLAARGHGEPANWDAAVGLVVRRCHAEGHDLQRRVRGRAHWDDGWVWSSWDPETSDLTACISAAEHTGPRPPEGVEVILSVVPAPSPQGDSSR